MTRASRAGFTLPEAIIALTISSMLVILVGTVFLVQNDFYSHVTVRSQVQENTRAATEIVASEVRSVASGGVVLADSSRMVVHSPIVTAAVCGSLGNDVMVHVQGGLSAIDTAEVAGFGYRDPSTGAWTYYDHPWSALTASGGPPAKKCFENGADTTGISSYFLRIQLVSSDTGVSAANLLGSVLMFYRKTEFRFDNSSLISGDRSLFWGLYGGTLKELVTGMSTNAHFEFRTGTNTWSKSITGATLATINGVRLQAESIGKGDASDELTYNFGFTVDIPLANAY